MAPGFSWSRATSRPLRRADSRAARAGDRAECRSGRRLLTKLDGNEWRVPAIVALYCGLRRGEQLALRWSNVNLDQGRLHVVEALEQSSAGVA